MRNIMKLLFFALFGIMVGSTNAIAGPALSFETTDLNLGPIYAGEIVEAGFKFVNNSDEELVIEKIASSCGCVVPEDAARSYAPGETGEISVQFDPSEAGTTGRVKKDIIVYSNDPKNSRVILSLRSFIYTIENGVPYEPATLDFKTIPVETSKTMTVTIYGEPFGQTVIEKVIIPEGFTYSLESIADESGVRRLVKISNNLRSQIGRVSETLSIHTSNKAQPVLRIPISLNIIGEISVEPSRLFFGHIFQGNEARKTVRLSSSNSSFNILEVTTDLQFIQISREKETASETQTLTAYVKGDAPPGRFKGTMTILTDSKYEPEIRIPVIGRVSATTQ